MESLPHRPLTVLTLAVDFAGIEPIGMTPAGFRSIAPVTGGSFAGERLSGIVLPGGQDWVITRADGTIAIDVRLTLETGDGVKVYLSYQGNMLASADAMRRFRKGEQLARDDYRLRAIAKFECGDENYAWLNDTIAVAIGEQRPAGPVYSIFEVG